jgi:integral membrane protein (TIGR01906 family)
MQKIYRTLYGLVGITIPFFILMLVVLILFQPWFLSFEYQKPDFPADRFGFSQDERLSFGTQSVLFVIQNQPAETLRQLQGGSQTPIYKESEVGHMVDVQKVFQLAKTIWLCIAVIYLISLLTAWHVPYRLWLLLRSVMLGSLLSIGLLVLLLVAAVGMFDTLFDQFHRLFFSDGSWLFYENDTLIRLFPLKLWSDAFLYAAVLAFILSVILLIAAKKGVDRSRLRN